MQNKKINFLVFSTDYDVVQLGLVHNGKVQEEVTEHKFTASKNLMSVILALLDRHNLTWNDLSFLATNQGPGPFTTLRVIITTLNGLSFATRLPLVGVDGLAALLKTKHTPAPTLALLNAFAQDAYYAYYQNNMFNAGWMPIHELLTTYKNQIAHEQPILIGNGTTVFQTAIQEQLPNAIIIQQAAPDLQTIADQALVHWHNQETSQLLLPLYLKTMNYKQST